MAYVLNLSVLSDSFVTPWTVARQTPLSMGILQTRILEWVAMLFSRGSSRPRDQTLVSCIAGRLFTVHSQITVFTDFGNVVVQLLIRARLFVTPWTVAQQTPLSVEFSRQEYWSGLPFPSPRDRPDPGIKPWSPALQAGSLLSEPPEKTF